MTQIKFNTTEEYLTEKSLGEFLSILFKGEEIIHNKKIKELGFRPDYYVPSRKLIIEFDGYTHFTDNKVVHTDMYKEHEIRRKEIQLIRIPYFVQLPIRNINILFENIIKDEYCIENDFNKYRDGFIDKKAGLPGTFSSLGLFRYEQFCTRLVREKGEDEMSLLLDIQDSLIHQLIWGSKSFFECFPETDLKNLTYHFQVLKDVYDVYSYEEENKIVHVINLTWYKNYIEAMLNIETNWSIDPEVNEITKFVETHPIN